MKSGLYAVQLLQVYIPALYLIDPGPALDNFTRFNPCDATKFEFQRNTKPERNGIVLKYPACDLIYGLVD